jgi:PmbA protein
MPDSLADRVAQAVALATRAGAQEAFASVDRSRSTSAVVRNGALEKLQESTSRGLQLQLYVEGRYSQHRTNDLRTEELQRFVSNAVALTRMLEPDPFRRLPEPGLYEGPRPAGLDLEDPAVTAVTQDELIALSKALNARLDGQDRVISAESTVSQGHAMSAAASSNGFVGTNAGTQMGMYASATLRDEGDARPEGGMGVSVRHRDRMVTPEALGDEALERARQRLGTRKGPTLTTAMVVDRTVASGLIWRLLRPASGSAVQQKRSMWAGQLGERKVSPQLTITNDPTLRGALGSRPFDSEGLPAFTMPLIERGVLRNYFLDTYSARKLEMRPTTGDWANIVVAPGAPGRDLDAIVHGIDEGVYVTSWLGGNADGTTGDFSLGLRGHLIDGGVVGNPVGEMNVTGNLLALFDRLAEVGGDPWTYSTIHVPTLVFDEVQFSGA